MAEQLSGRELDAAVAERVMGWRMQWFDRIYGLDDREWTQHPAASKAECRSTPVAYWRRPDGSSLDEVDTWSPSSSIEAAMQVEDRIAELGLQKLYFTCLMEEVCDSVTDPRSACMFDIVHASAEQRCRAALKAVGQEK